MKRDNKTYYIAKMALIRTFLDALLATLTAIIVSGIVFTIM